jgi:hypothetical protein
MSNILLLNSAVMSELLKFLENFASGCTLLKQQECEYLLIETRDI